MTLAKIGANGWAAYNIWEHSASVRELYRLRARDEVEEMTCAAQGAEILGGLAKQGESILDVGCGAGHFFHSLRRRSLALDYYGIDSTGIFIAAGREALPVFGLPADRLQCMRIEDLAGEVDHVLCMNVLSNLDNYHRPLERLLHVARKSVILRESIRDGGHIGYVRDEFLDPDVSLNVYVNAYDRHEITSFIESYGFEVREEIDRRTGGRPEDVIGHPHYWTFLVAQRRG